MNPTPTINPSDELGLSLRIEPTFKVDRAAAQLHDLAILTADREASGHGIYIDQKTLQTAFACAQASGGKLRGAIRHPSLLDVLKGDNDRVLGMPGFFSDVKIAGNTLVAGTFQFFDTFAASEPATVARILEMAEKTPELFGLSAEPCGQFVWVGLDGSEHPAKRDPETRAWAGQPKGVALANLGLPTLRITHLGVAAFVDQPAANDGLFAKLGRLFGGKQALDLSTLRDLATAFLRWSAEQGAPAQNAFVTAPTDAGTALGATSANTASPMTTITDIKAKFGADKAHFTRAIELLSEDSTLTVEAIEAKLAAADHAALTAQLATLTTAQAELSTKLAAAESATAVAIKERDEWKTKFEAMKASGQAAPVVLSTPGTGEAAVAPFGRSRVAAAFTAKLAAN